MANKEKAETEQGGFERVACAWMSEPNPIQFTPYWHHRLFKWMQKAGFGQRPITAL